MTIRKAPAMKLAAQSYEAGTDFTNHVRSLQTAVAHHCGVISSFNWSITLKYRPAAINPGDVCSVWPKLVLQQQGVPSIADAFVSFSASWLLFRC
jgi:hypothetical protein